MVGLGVDLADIADYVAHNDLGTARAAARARARAASPGRSCSPRAWSSTARAATAAPSTGSCGPAPRAPEDLDAGRFEPPCPALRARRSSPSAVPEDAPLDPRNVYAATKVAQEHLCAAFARETGATVTALRYHNVYGPRMPRDTPYAGVASIFRSSLAAGRRAARVRGRRASGATSSTCATSPRANVLGARRPATPGAFNVASGTPRTRGGDGRRARPRRRPGARRPVVTGEWRGGDVRHVFASPERAATRARLPRAPRTSRRACASSPRRSCAHDAVRRRRPRRVDRVRRASRTSRSRARSSTPREWFSEAAGSAAVVAVQLAKLSGDVDFFTALGTDERGRRSRGAADRARRARPRRAARGDAALGLRPPRRRRRAHDLDRRRAPRAARRRRPAVGAPGRRRRRLRLRRRPRRDARRRAARSCSSRRRAPPRRSNGIRIDALVGSGKDRLEQLDPDALDPPPELVVTTAGKEGGTWQAGEQREGPSRPPSCPARWSTRTAPATRSPAGVTYALGAGYEIDDALAFAARAGAANLTGRGPYAGQLTALSDL